MTKSKRSDTKRSLKRSKALVTLLCKRFQRPATVVLGVNRRTALERAEDGIQFLRTSVRTLAMFTVTAQRVPHSGDLTLTSFLPFGLKEHLIYDECVLKLDVLEEMSFKCVSVDTGSLHGVLQDQMLVWLHRA